MTRQRGRFEHIDSYTYATAPLSAGLAEAMGWGGQGSAIERRRRSIEGEGHAGCHSIQRRLTAEKLICYLQGLCTHLRGIASAHVHSLARLWQQHADTGVSSGAAEMDFFLLGFSENNAKYGSMEREQQQDLPLKDGCIHVSSEVKMQTGGPSYTRFLFVKDKV